MYTLTSAGYASNGTLLVGRDGYLGMLVDGEERKMIANYVA